MSDIDDLRDEIWRLRTDLRTRARSEANNIYTLTDQVRAIVPTINQVANGAAGQFSTPSDVYYAYLGLTSLPPYFVGAATYSGNTALQQWDATEKRFYVALTSGGVAGYVASSSGTRIIYPTGVGGSATSFSPKNPDAVQCVIGFRAKFGNAATYSVQGIGAVSDNALNDFTAMTHGFAVARTAAAWQLTTKDGTTSSASTGGSADSNWHDFQVVWTLGATPTMTLYVDNVSTITKTTNLPAQPLSSALVGGATNTVSIIDIYVAWEGS